MEHKKEESLVDKMRPYVDAQRKYWVGLHQELARQMEVLKSRGTTK